MAQLDKIGKYEILEKIGEGGFGVVYKGKDPFIKRLVAVKTCSSDNESIQKRFFREAEIAGNLHHANVVTIHDFGVEGETPYLVQEFLTGEDLDVLIADRERPLALATKVHYLRGIAEGLRYAHAQGVIHRDIKPANIRILENNRVKVMDFGIAKLKDQESQLTQTGMALGTVAYMSPEQLKGEKVDHRVDIFSFGVLAYELLVGKRPFHAESVSTLFYQLLHEEPPPIEDAAIPAELEAVVSKCLAKTLDVRYKTFDEVLVDLDAVQALVGEDQEAITDDPFSGDATSSVNRLAAKVARSIEAGNLTAAQQALDIARRDCDRATFDRELGPLAARLEASRSAAATSAAGGEAVDLTSQIAAVDGHLMAGRTDAAAVAFTALELQHPQHPGVTELRQRISQAIKHPPSAPPPSTATPPPMPVGRLPEHPVTEQQVAPVELAGASAGRQKAPAGPLIAALAAVVLLGTVGAIVVARTVLGFGSEPAANGDTATGLATPSDPGNASATAGSDPFDTVVPPPPGGDDAGDAGDQASSGERSADVTGDRTPPSSDAGSSRPASGDRAPSGTSSSQATPTRPSSTGDRGRPAGGDRTQSSGGSQSSDRPSGTGTRTSDQGGRTTTDRPATTPPQDRPSQPSDQQSGSGSNQSQSPAGDQGAAGQPSDSKPAEADEFSMERIKNEAEIRNALAVYEAAWESRDHNAINSIHPAASLSRRDVRSYREIAVEIGRCTIDIAGNQATASCPITLVKTAKSGPETVRYSSVTLVNQGGRWLISQVR